MRRIYSGCVIEVSRGSLLEVVDNVDTLIIDLASITYGSDPSSFINNIRLALDYGYLRQRVIFVVDYWSDAQRSVVQPYVELLRDLGLDYVLSRSKPAEITAAEMCREIPRCIVLSRDYDPLQIVDEEIQPVGYRHRWIVRKIRIDRECVKNLSLRL